MKCCIFQRFSLKLSFWKKLIYKRFGIVPIPLDWDTLQSKSGNIGAKKKKKKKKKNQISSNWMRNNVRMVWEHISLETMQKTTTIEKKNHPKSHWEYEVMIITSSKNN